MKKMKLITLGALARATENEDGTWNITDENGNHGMTVNEEELSTSWVAYECLPDDVLTWYSSVLDQKMPLAEALGFSKDVPLSEYDYRALTVGAYTWLQVPENQLQFAQAMLIGPRVSADMFGNMISNMKNKEETRWEQINLF